MHGAGGFADGHYGDKLAYVSAKGARPSGGWSWGCSHNEGIALHAEKSGPFASRGAASAAKNPDDASGRGWTVKPKSATHQVAVAFLKNRNSGPGKAIQLSDTKGVEHVNVHLAPYGKDRLLLSWEPIKNARCKDGTCTGAFAGTQLRLIDWNGKFRSADKVVQARITGDLAVSADGTLTWAYVPVTPSCATPLTGASPTTTTLRIARLGL